MYGKTCTDRSDLYRHTRHRKGRLQLGLILGLGFLFTLAPSEAYAVGQLLCYQGTEALGKNKKNIIQACDDLKCTERQKQYLIAIAMQESNDCCAQQRDASKDCTPSANYSCFNINKDMLEVLGWHEGGPDLNDNANVIHAIAYIIAAEHAWGMDKFLAFHRGGRTAFNDGVSYGVKEYTEAINAVVKELQENPDHMTDDWRLGYEVPHV